MMNLMDFIKEVPSGTVRAYFVPNLQQFALIPAWQEQLEEEFRIMTISWQKIPPIETVIDTILHEFANTALALWPYWYGNKALATDWGDKEEALNLPVQDQEFISKNWLIRAITNIKKHREPLLPQFPKAIQARQLALAISPNLFHLIVVVQDLNPVEGRVLGMVKALEWVASQIQSSILILVDNKIASHPELTSVAHDWPINTPAMFTQLSAQTAEEHQTALWPVIGRPHPHSPGEQWLASHLEKDPELKSLFGFNQEVQTTQGTRYLVDVLWREGHLAVEVDGYSFHSQRAAFVNDRQRDYELLLTGYRVLRLDHEEILINGERCLEKIRKAVRYIKNQIAAERISQ